MAVKAFYCDADFLKVGQLLNTRQHNVTSSEMLALGLTLSLGNQGLFVWNTDLGLEFIWDGIAFVNQISDGNYITYSQVIALLESNRLKSPQFTYDTSGRLASITYANGAIKRFLFTGNVLTTVEFTDTGGITHRKTLVYSGTKLLRIEEIIL